MEKGIILVGSKPFSVYVKAIMTVMEESNEVLVKSRGKNISNTASICEFLSRTKELKINDITLGSNVFIAEDKKERTVTEISIKLTK